MKDEQKVYIRGVEGRGDEVLKMLEDRGGKHLYDGGNQPARIYFIGYDGMVYSAPIESVTGKILMDCYIELHLPEKWKVGDILIKNDRTCYMVFREDDPVNDTTFYACNVSINVGGTLSLHSGSIWHGEKLLCCRKDYRLATLSEIKRFHELFHDLKKEWDSENLKIVDWEWEPKEGDDYYYIDMDGDIMPDTWDEDDLDVDRYNFGNCFQTEEEAEAMAEKVKKLLKGE